MSKLNKATKEREITKRRNKTFKKIQKILHV